MPSGLLKDLASATAGVVGTAFLRVLLRHLAEAYGARGAYLAERNNGAFIVTASWGDALPEGADARSGRAEDEAAPGDEFVLPLTGSGGDVIAMLVLDTDAPIEPPPEEREAIEIFMARAAAEVERRRAEQVLRAREAEAAAAGARLVERVDGQRRRVGRDLHDGAQQRLVVLGQRLDLARRQVHDDPDGASVMLDTARDEVRAVGQELRDIARGLHPTGLQQHGLAGALKALASRSPLPVDVRGLPDRRLPDAVEATIYYLVAEAIANTVKHAEASAMTVDVGFRGGAVVGEIADNGRGGAVVQSGGGLEGLGDRVAAVGGTLAVESVAGSGTRLHVNIPMQRWRTLHEPFLEFGYQGDEGEGERSIRQILSGEKTASVSLEREWALEGGVPRIGQRLPVRDYTGRQWCCVEVERVALLPFGAVGGEVAAAEASGAADAEEWRASHRAFYDASRHELAVLLGEPGWRLTDEEPMAIIWFRLVEKDAAREEAAQRPPSQ